MRRFLFTGILAAAAIGLLGVPEAQAQRRMRPFYSAPINMNPMFSPYSMANPYTGLSLRSYYGMPIIVSPPNYYAPYYTGYLWQYSMMYPSYYQSPGYSYGYTPPAGGYGSSTSAYGSAAKKTYPENGTEVGVYDDYFQPRTLTVAPGTTVIWHNHGYHRHTITADDGSWDAGDLVVNGDYKHTFTQSGTYNYHCRVHGTHMSGTIVVK